MDASVSFIVCGVNSHYNMKNKMIVAAVFAALATTANAGSFGFSVLEYSKSVDGQGVPVYYAPAPAQAPVVSAPVVQAPVAQAPAAPVTTAAPVVAAPAPTPNVVAVPNGNGTYTLVPVVNSAPPQQPQPYLIPAAQVPIHKERKRFSIGPRFSWD